MVYTKTKENKDHQRAFNLGKGGEEGELKIEKSIDASVDLGKGFGGIDNFECSNSSYSLSKTGPYFF